MKRQTQKQGFVSKKENPFRVFYKHLVAGITYMIPVCVAGGIIFALSYLIDTCCGVKPDALQPGQVFGQVNQVAKVFNKLGSIGLGAMFPVLACFIAYSIAGKRAIAPGIIGGLATAGSFSVLYLIKTGGVIPISVTQETEAIIRYMTNSSSGFIGALFSGFAAGYLVILFGYLLRNMKGAWTILRDFMLVPFICTFIVGMGMFLFNVPVSYLNYGIGEGLTKISNAGYALVVAALVSALMASDMGGPINKAAHFFCIDRLSIDMGSKMYQGFMGANIVGIMVPPIAIAMSIWLFPKKYAKEDRDPSIGNCLIGFCGITDTAIPYVAKDPVRVIGCSMLGAAAGGIMSYAWGFGAVAPEGGTFSMITMGASCYKGIISTIAGSAVAALLLGITKKNVDPKLTKLGKWKGLSIGNGIGFVSIKNTLAEKVVLENACKDKKARLDIKLQAKKGKVSDERFAQLTKQTIAKKAKLDKQLAEKQAKLDKRYKDYQAKKAAKNKKKKGK